MTRIRRVDANQGVIVKTFRDMGAKVLILSEVGKGVPDILVGIDRGATVKKSGKNRYVCLLAEIKDGSKPPSARKLTEDEQKFHNEWTGFVRIINSIEDVKNLMAELANENEYAQD